MRRVEYTLRGHRYARVVTRPVAVQLAEWLRRTYRIEPEVTHA